MLEEVADKGTAPVGIQWEYLLVADRGRMHHVDVDELNRLGRDGWELITIIFETRTQTSEVHFYFKRHVA